MDAERYFRQLILVIQKANRSDLIAFGKLSDQKKRYIFYKKKDLARFHRYMKQLYHDIEYNTYEGRLQPDPMKIITLRDYLVLKKLQKGNYRGVIDILRGEHDCVKKKFHSIVMKAMCEKLR